MGKRKLRIAKVLAEADTGVPLWVRLLMQPQKLSTPEIVNAIQRVTLWVNTFTKNGRSCLPGQRVLEKLEREFIHRKARSNYVHFVQGGSPGMGKHKS